jgi:CRISPR/Cas system-associated endonuclease Cas3-HD
MWFCITCRRKIEEHIVLDLKIEDRCNQIMKEYEDRITQLEPTVMEKCDEKVYGK